MASRRTSTWPLTNQLGIRGTRKHDFISVASWIRERNASESTLKAESLEDTTSLEDTQVPSKFHRNDNTTTPSRIRKLSQSLGFETLYLAFQELRGYAVVEEKKIVILSDLRSACYVSLLHIIPNAAAVTLLVLIWRGYYIGSELSGIQGQDGLKFLGLQFASKMLELLAVGSLSTILFALLRALLISDSLPFGALTAGFEFNKLSMLWSKEFVATCATKFSSPARKILVVTTIIVFTMLAATVGPSAAVASSPVLRNWPAGGTVFWLNATSQQLWPSHLDGVSSPDLPCASSQNDSCFPSNFDLLAGELLSLWPPTVLVDADDDTLPTVMPEKAIIPGRRSMHTLATRFQGPFTYQPFITTTTTPSAAISDALSQIERYWFIANEGKCTKKASFCYYNDFFATVNAMQPVTYVRCNHSDVDATVRFPRLDQAIENYPSVDYNNKTIGTRQWFDVSTGNGTNPGLSWVELPEADFGRTSIGAIIALPGANTKDHPDQVLASTVDARWVQTTATLSFLGGPMIVSGIPASWLGGGQYQLDSNGQLLWPQVTMSPAWAESINPIVAEPSVSAFTALCNSVGRMSNITIAPWSLNAVESVLAVMITDSLARTNSMATILGSLKGLNNGEWRSKLLPKGSVYGTGGSAFNYTFESGDQSTMLQATVTVNGYGCGTTAATLLSTIVLAVYSVIAMSYVIYSICFAKTTSSSWESITELVALALNSRPSSTLKNAGAGIATLRTLKQPVSIGISDDRLQMVFEDVEGREKVKPNERYG